MVNQPLRLFVQYVAPKCSKSALSKSRLKTQEREIYLGFFAGKELFLFKIFVPTFKEGLNQVF